MWAKRKPKNRRLGREFVLDVRLRSSKLRAARSRMAAVALGAVFATVFSVFLLWRAGEWALDRLVYENPAFAVTTIDLQTDGIIAVDQLRRWAGLRVGQNLMALDLARIKRDLELVSLVRSVSVERILPHTLRIRVTEREPLAQIHVPRPRAGGGVELGIFQLDEDGYVMLPLEANQRGAAPAQPPETLPIIEVPNALDVQPGRTNDSPQVQAAIQFLLAFERSPMSGLVEIKRIDTSAPEVLLVTASDGSEVTVALGDFDERLGRWQRVFEAGQKRNLVIVTLDLAVNDFIPARWLEASAAPPTTTKAPRTPRKKHV